MIFGSIKGDLPQKLQRDPVAADSPFALFRIGITVFFRFQKRYSEMKVRQGKIASEPVKFGVNVVNGLMDRRFAAAFQLAGMGRNCKDLTET